MNVDDDFLHIEDYAEQPEDNEITPTKKTVGLVRKRKAFIDRKIELTAEALRGRLQDCSDILKPQQFVPEIQNSSREARLDYLMNHSLDEFMGKSVNPAIYSFSKGPKKLPLQKETSAPEAIDFGNKNIIQEYQERFLHLI
jgi:hypothetical protein